MSIHRFSLDGGGHVEMTLQDREPDMEHLLAQARKEEDDEQKALSRLKAAAVLIAGVLDAGERDPTWNESQELEESAIQYGRAVIDNTSATRSEP